MTKLRNTSLLIDKSDITHSRISELEIQKIEDGEVLLKVDEYAFTTNNITYAVIGHKLGYWNFFPVDKTWGIVPVWGYATIVESRCKDLEAGQVYYGYFPMSDYLKVKPGKVSSGGFSDMADHRQSLPPIYNYYSNISVDPVYSGDYKEYMPIVRPLFTTSFLNYYFLKDHNFYDADQVILTSASSKTAMGIAYMLKVNQEKDNKKVIGITSERNIRFVKQTGFYDEVIGYDSVIENLNIKPSVLVDLLGSGQVLNIIESFLDGQLKYISLIGLTDWEAGMGKASSKSEFFFAPTQAQKLFKEWGPIEANQKIGQGLMQFVDTIQDWIDIVNVSSYENLALLYHEMLEGNVDPKRGYIISMEP